MYWQEPSDLHGLLKTGMSVLCFVEEEQGFLEGLRQGWVQSVNSGVQRNKADGRSLSVVSGLRQSVLLARSGELCS